MKRFAVGEHALAQERGDRARVLIIKSHAPAVARAHDLTDICLVARAERDARDV